MREKIEIIRGDRRNIAFTLKDYDGVAINLTGASLKFKIQEQGAETLAADEVMIIDTPLQGKCYLQIDATFDTIAAGFYDGEIEITYAGTGEIITYGDILVIIKKDLPK